MIIYNPLDGMPLSYKVDLKPRSCFFMTQLSKNVDEEVKLCESKVREILSEFDYEVITAVDIVGGRDILLKIWKMLAASPIALGVLHERIPSKTTLNIVYEFGVAQALGKETALIKSDDMEIPSDLMRTEYLNLNTLEGDLRQYMESLLKSAEFYKMLSQTTENNPLLSLDYMKRAYSLTGDEDILKDIKSVFLESDFSKRAKNSIENVLVSGLI